MMDPGARICLDSLLLIAVLMANPVNCADLYVAPQGSPSGPGTIARPYDLVTALSGSVSHPGDVFWLRNGTYHVGHVATQACGTAKQTITFRQFPGEHAKLVGSLSIWGKGRYLVFRDFELCSGVTHRFSRQRGAGFSPPDLTDFVEGIQVYSPNISFINLSVHDSVRSGFYTSSEATNTLIYGCMVYNSGWASRKEAEGHSYYLQGAGEISDNLAFNSAGANFHVYANAEGACLQNLTLDGNVAFGAGALQTARPYRDWIVGVDAPSVRADNIILRNNMGYLTPNATTLKQVQLGREQNNGSLSVSSNYWPQTVMVNNWRQTRFLGNVVMSENSDSLVALQESFTKRTATWNHNLYHSPSSLPFHIGSKRYSFAQWKTATGFDPDSSWTSGPLTGTKIFVRPNRYAPGRAHIIVYNWDCLTKVAVDIGSVLPVGTSFEVRNAEDFFAPPVRSGVFDGRPLELPMTGLTVAKPVSELKAPAPTGPVFNVFVLLPKAGPSSVQ